MLIPAETLQKLVDRQVALDHQAAQFMEYQLRGDTSALHFAGLPKEQQETLLAREDIAQAVSAAQQGDQAGTQRSIESAVNRQLYGGAQLVRRQVAPRRKRGRS